MEAHKQALSCGIPRSPYMPLSLRPLTGTCVHAKGFSFLETELAGIICENTAYSAFLGTHMQTEQ
jgi:hypothetical protein